MMKLKEARLNFMVNREGTTIELIDNEASITFAKITLSPEQLSMALARFGNTPCEIELIGLDKVGKTMEHTKHEFEIPDDIEHKDRRKTVSEIAKETCPEGWIVCDSFSSQDTFFKKDGKSYARGTIRRYV